MKINKLIISKNKYFSTSIYFDSNNFITSKKNSVGKTTLIRFLPYAFGFNVSSTKKVNMKNHETYLSITDNRGEIVIERNSNDMAITFADGVAKKYNLNIEDERILALSAIFNTSNINLIRNLLQVIYIEQDYGWSINKKGNIFGNKLDIIEFFAALSDVDLSKINSEINRLGHEKKKYEALKKMIELKPNFSKSHLPTFLKEDDGKDERVKLIVRKSQLQREQEIVSRKIRQLERTLTDNRRLLEHILEYNLIIKHNNDKFILTKDNIVDYQINNNILVFQKNNEIIKLENLKSQLVEVEQQLQLYNELVTVEDQADNIIRKVIDTNISLESVEKIIGSISKEYNEAKEKRDKAIENKKSLLNEASNLVKKFAVRLGVYEGFLENEKNFIFMKLSNKYTGAIKNKIVFSFRLAYLILASEKLGFKLPFIIDSPGSNEMTLENVRMILQLTKETLVGHQLFISTIHDDVMTLFDSGVKHIFLEKLLLDYKVL